MFGSTKALAARLAALEADTARRLAALEARIDRAEGHLSADPAARTRFLLAHAAEDLRSALERAARDIERADDLARAMDARAHGEGERAPRQRLALGRVYQASYTGYVALFFTGGRTDSVELLVGPTAPPDLVVCSLDSRHDINAYAACVVRRGEHWLARSQFGDDSGVQCVYTPFL